MAPYMPPKDIPSERASTGGNTGQNVMMDMGTKTHPAGLDKFMGGAQGSFSVNNKGGTFTRPTDMSNDPNAPVLGSTEMSTTAAKPAMPKNVYTSSSVQQPPNVYPPVG